MNEIERILAYHRNASENGPGAAERKKRVLVVEGDGFTRITLMNCLLAAGFDVDFAPNGRLGLHQLRMWKPDTLIMEINLRDLSGMDLIKRARQEPSFKNRPIYVFTSIHFLKRSTRKELSTAGVQLFDKLSIAPETVVVSVASELLTGKPATDLGDTGRLAARLPDGMSETMAEIWLQAKTLARCTDPAKRAAACAELREKVYSLLSHAAVGGYRKTARQAKALVDFLDHLCEQSQQVSDVALNTVARSIEVLSGLAQEKAQEPGDAADFKVVVVGETTASCNSIQETFQGAGIEPVSFSDPAQALEHLAAEPADLIITNLSAAGQEAFDLAKVRALQLHQETPVIAAPQAAPEGGDGSLPAIAPEVEPESVGHTELLMQALNVLQKPAADDALAASIAAEPGAPTHEVPGTALPESDRLHLVGDGFQGRLIEPPSARLEAPQEQVAASQPGTPPQSGAAGKPRAKRRKGTVLFVEDDPVLLKVYKRALKADGYRVEVVEDGLAAIESMPKLRPDLVILDLMLPKMHGLEVLKFMRADMNLKSTPVVILSNAFMEGLAAKAMQEGANKGLLKSQCTPAQLVEVVSELVATPIDPSSPPDMGQVDAGTSFVAYGENGETSIWTRKDKSRRDAPAEISKIRQACMAYVKSAGSAGSMERLAVLYRRVRFFGARASLSSFTKLAEVAGAFEALLFEIIYKKVEPTPSILQTVVQTVDCLGNLVEKGDTAFPEPVVRPRVLVVDDDAVCTMTTVAALKLANVQAVGTQDPKESLRILESGKFDIVMLDVEMPGLDGYQVCEQLRRMPQHKTTPVLFFTSNGDVTRRARGVLVGGNDFAMKPITSTELVLKLTLQWVKAAPRADATPQERADNAQMLIPTESGLSSSPLNGPEIGTAGTADRTLEGLQVGERENFADSGRQTPGQETTDEPPSELRAETEARGEKATESPVTGEDSPPGDEAAASIAIPIEEVEDKAGPFYLGQSQQLQPEDKLAKLEKERQALVTRVFNSENELHQERARLKRRERTIENLQKKLEDLQAKVGPGTADGNGETRQEPAPDTAALAKSAQEAEVRCRQLEGELADLRKAREELDAKVARDQEQTAETSRRSKDLEDRLNERSEELARAKTELEKQASDQARNEGQLREQLQAAETARKEAQSRCSQVEDQLSNLRKAREELDAKVSREQEQTAALDSRSKDLEKQLSERTAELELARQELEKRTREQVSTEAELWQELEAAVAGQKQAQERCSQLEKDLGELRKSREELDARVKREAGALEESAKQVLELDQRSKLLEGQLKERSAELDRARAELEEAGAGQKQAQERCRILERELETVRKAQEELDAKAARERKQSSELEARSEELQKQLSDRSAELERAKKELEKRDQLHSTTEAELWKELDVVTSAQKQSQERCGQLEKELASLRQAREELDARVKSEAQAAEESAKRAALLDQRGTQLEKELQNRWAELQGAQAELKRQGQDRSETENELRRKLEALTGEQKQSQARCAQLETELTALRQAREALEAKGRNLEERAGVSEKRGAELENQLKDRAAQLDKVRKELEKQGQRHSTAEAELQKQLSATGAGQKQAQERCTQLEQELADLRQAREELATKAVREQEHTNQLSKRSAELEERLGQTSQELERAKIELEKQCQAHAEAEAGLRSELEKVGSDQKQAHARCRHLEAELAALNQAREELNVKVEREQGQAAESSKRSKELENRLADTSTELARARKELEKRNKEQFQAESKLWQELETLGASHKQAQVRCSQLEGELAALCRVREELSAKAAWEQEQTTQLSRKSAELEERLTATSKELELAKTNLEKQGKAHSQVEAELRRELDTVGAGQKQAQVRCSQLSVELAALRQAREELNLRVSREQGQAAESSKRSQELEERLGATSQELERAKAELEKQGQDRSQVEKDLRQQLSAAGETQKELLGRCSQLEKDLSKLQQARQELDAKVAGEKIVSAQSIKRSEELAKSLEQASAELAQSKANLAAQVDAHARVEADLRGQLDALGNEQKQTHARCGLLEGELAGLRQAREVLNVKVAGEATRVAELEKQGKQLETKLTERSAELERSRAELRKQKKEHSKAEAELRRQLDALGLDRKQAEERYSALEGELEKLRQNRKTLNAQIAGETERAGQSERRSKELEARLEATFAELNQARAELENQGRASSHVEARLRQQLESATTGQAQARELCSQLHLELANLQQGREELNLKLAGETNRAGESERRSRDLERRLADTSAELNRARTELEQQASERAQLEAGLSQQLESATNGQNQARELCGQLERELAGLQQARDSLKVELGAEKQRTGELEKHSKDLENRLEGLTAELESARAENAKQTQEHSNAEAALRQQLESTSAGQKLAQARCTQLEGELSDVRIAREELSTRFAAEQNRVVQLDKRSQELEQHLKERSTELAGTRTELEHQATEHSKAEAELWQQLDVADAGQKQAQARCSQLEGELAGLRQVRDELSGRLAQEQKTAADLGKRGLALEKQLEQTESAHRLSVTELEDRIRRGVNALTRVTSDLEKERADHVRAEEQNALLAQRLEELHAELGRHLQNSRASQQRIATLEQQLRQTGEKQARLQADVEQERAQAQLAEEQLKRASELNERYQKNIASLGQANMVLLSSREDLQRMLESNLGILHKTEAQLEHETAELQRLSEEMEAARRNLQGQKQTIDRQALQLAEFATTSGDLATRLQTEAATRARLAEEAEAAQRNLRTQAQTIERQNAQINEALELSRNLEGRLQSEGIERQRLNAELESARRNLHTQTQAIARQDSQIQETRELARELDARLQGAVAERQRLVEELQTAQRRLQEQNQAMVQQELRVNADLETAAALESRLQKESAERQSLQQELQAARRAATVESEKRQIESSKHQADLHNELVERRRLETNVVRLRHATIKAARAGRIVRQKLRQQTNQPVEALLHSLRNLMASEISLDQKDRLEEMLEQVLLLKASIQEPRLRAAGGNNGGCNQ